MTIVAACLAALLSTQTIDTATTVHLLSRPGYHEGNQILPSSRGGILAAKAGMTTGVALYGWKIRKHHPKLAAGLFLVGAASGGIGAWHNTRLIRRSHR